MMMTTDYHSLRDTTHGYWGKPTATIDWCERNYQHSFYIAEFWNTLSNVLFVALGLYGLSRSVKEGFEWRFHAQFIAVMITGLGSAMFHGTLQLVHQQCDETPMVWAALVWIFIVYNNEIQMLGLSDKVVIPCLVVIGFMFGTLATACAARLMIHYMQVKDERARSVARSYVRNSLIGLIVWLADYHLCHHLNELPVNPQGHAWWHIFMGISSYHGPVFMQYVRLEQLKKRGVIVDTGFGIDTITISDGQNNINDSTGKKHR